MEARHQMPIVIPSTVRAGGLTIVCISDTHDQLHKITNFPRGDVVVHTGDFSSAGSRYETSLFLKSFQALEYSAKLFIAGNHEVTLDANHRSYDETCKALVKTAQTSDTDHIRYLEHEGCVIYVEDAGVNVRFFGSPWQPEHCGMAFNLRSSEDLARKWLEVPSETEVLLTHTPPYHILDNSKYGKSCGCKDLRRCLVENTIKPRLHVFGHIHECHGHIVNNDVLFVNAATCNVNYRPVNTPITIFLPFDKALPPEVVHE